MRLSVQNNIARPINFTLCRHVRTGNAGGVSFLRAVTCVFLCSDQSSTNTTAARSSRPVKRLHRRIRRDCVTFSCGGFPKRLSASASLQAACIWLGMAGPLSRRTCAVQALFRASLHVSSMSYPAKSLLTGNRNVSLWDLLSGYETYSRS